ncbi:MAG: hypothetical protein V4495_04800, partial [Pseudomonadota bacterium]
MKAIISVWMQPVYARINTGSLKILYIMLGLFAVAPVVAVFFVQAQKPDWQSVMLALALGVAGVLGILLLSWFILLVPSVALQYTPAYAALVPQMKRHMQFALAIPILLMPVAFPLILRMHMQEKFFQGWFFGVLSLLIYIASIRSTWVI